ncbi:unnamed protein product [Ectocarpus sp. 12 AP-2014]
MILPNMNIHDTFDTKSREPATYSSESEHTSLESKYFVKSRAHCTTTATLRPTDACLHTSNKPEPPNRDSSTTLISSQGANPDKRSSPSGTNPLAASRTAAKKQVGHRMLQHKCIHCQ